MGSKSNPGKFDCWAKAEPDEPMFVLLGRDPAAWVVVNFWVALRRELGEGGEKLAEAVDCARAMQRWASEHGKDVHAAAGAYERLLKKQGEILESSS